MKSAKQIVEESGYGPGFSPAANDFKERLGTYTEIVVRQEGDPPTDRALTTVMALCAIVNRSQGEIEMMVSTDVNPAVLLRERREILLGNKIGAQAHFSSAYGKVGLPGTFAAWKAAGCPTGSQYVDWNARQSAPDPYAAPAPASAPWSPGFGTSGAPNIHTGPSMTVVRGATIKLTASQESIAKQFGRDPAEIAAWRASNVPGQ